MLQRIEKSAEREMAGVILSSISVLMLFFLTIATMFLSVAAPHVFAFWMVALGMGLLPAARAYYKGRNFFAWWLYGTLIWIIAMPHAILLRPKSTRGAFEPDGLQAGDPLSEDSEWGRLKQ
jgi:hypothetical protein